MLYRINAILFYTSIIAFLIIAIAFLSGFIEIIAALNFCLTCFGFISLFLGLMLTKKSPKSLKIGIVGLITFGSIIWILAINSVIEFYVFWKYALLFIFSGIMWAVWNKVYSKGSVVLKIIFAISFFALLLNTILTCFSYFDNSDILFYTLVFFSSSALMISLLHKKSTTTN